MSGRSERHIQGRMYFRIVILVGDWRCYSPEGSIIQTYMWLLFEGCCSWSGIWETTDIHLIHVTPFWILQLKYIVEICG